MAFGGSLFPSAEHPHEERSLSREERISDVKREIEALSRGEKEDTPPSIITGRIKELKEDLAFLENEERNIH
ncbi:MAG: hypothetical protein Q8O83_02850 [bacterium]|nr:hypothetical protein [bacterium]